MGGPRRMKARITKDADEVMTMMMVLVVGRMVTDAEPE